MFRHIVGMACLAVSLNVHAIGYVSGKVTDVRVDKSGKGMISFDANIGGEYATCRQSAYVNALSFDSTTAGGKSILAFALTAKTTGVSVSAWGTGTCSIYGGNWVEDFEYGQMH